MFWQVDSIIKKQGEGILIAGEEGDDLAIVAVIIRRRN